MSRRILLNGSGLKFGPADVDVASATESTLLFDSTGQPYNGIFQIGSTTGVYGWSGYVLTIPFGTTLSTIPRFRVFIIDPNQGDTLTPLYFCQSVQQGGGGQNSGMTVIISASASTTNLIAASSVLDYGGGVRFAETPDLVYLVLTN